MIHRLHILSTRQRKERWSASDQTVSLAPEAAPERGDASNLSSKSAMPRAPESDAAEAKELWATTTERDWRRDDYHYTGRRN